ncbi:hypothetical protein LCGC14_1190870 [marine sediment metagenome]|uniref:Uncharacterized protein n=1 Tax=marine sediment metagenome TaxID=412755 RepID=A0A0F9M768_9ZZZZ
MQHMVIPLGSLESRSNPVRPPGRASAAVNVDIEKTNRVSRRKGFVRRADTQLSGPVRMLFSFQAFSGHFYRYVDGAGLIYVAGSQLQFPAYPSLSQLIDPYFEIVPEGEPGNWPVRETAFNIVFTAKQADGTDFPAYAPEGRGFGFSFDPSSSLDKITPSGAPTIWNDGVAVAEYTIEGGSSPSMFRIILNGVVTIDDVLRSITGVGYGMILDPEDDQDQDFNLPAPWTPGLPLPEWEKQEPTGAGGAGAFGIVTTTGEVQGIGVMAPAQDSGDPDIEDPADLDTDLRNFRAAAMPTDEEWVQLDWDYPEWITDDWKALVVVEIFRATDDFPEQYGDGERIYADNGNVFIDKTTNTAYESFYSAWLTIFGMGLFGPFQASAAGLLDSFSLTIPATILRGEAFNFEILALKADGNALQSYAPRGDVNIAYNFSDDDDVGTPASTPKTGWSGGGKTVSVTVRDGSGVDTALLTVTDDDAIGTALEAVNDQTYVFSDNFNRANGHPGLPWVTTTMVISGNKLVRTTIQGDVVIPDQGFNIIEASASVDAVGTGPGNVSALWAIVLGGAASADSYFVALRYEKLTGLWDAYFTQRGGPANIFISGVGQPPTGMLALTVVNEVPTASFGGQSFTGVAQSVIARMRLHLSVSPDGPSVRALDNFSVDLAGQ